jgi:ribonuclease Z
MNYKKKREGRKIAIIADTLPLKQVIEESKKADLLIHEATFLDKQKEKANEAMHSTALDAAIIAKKAKVKKLALFHFSARNTNTEEILEEAKKQFSNTIIPNELETITI